MRKSLLITYFFPPKIGGIENYLWNVCQRLPKSKSKVESPSFAKATKGRQKLKVEDFDKIVVLADLEKASSLLGSREDGIMVYQTRFFSWKFFKPSWLPLIWKVWKIIKKEKIEILQFGHYAHYCLIGILFKKLFNSIINHRIFRKFIHFNTLEYWSAKNDRKFKVLIYIHGVDFWIHQKGWFGKWLMKLNFKNADRIIANSYFMREEILKLGIGEEKVAVVQPGVDYNKFQIPDSRFQIPDSKQDFDNQGILQDDIKGKKVILSLGRFIRRKGFDLVLKSLPEVIKKAPNLIYLIVGEGEAEKELKKLTKKLNLEKYVVFCGPVRELEEKKVFYALSDVFVSPSRDIQYESYSRDVESFGIVYLEAAACGKPVIATKIGGIPEAVSDGQTGILIPPDDSQALAQALIKLLIDKDLAEQLGKQGRERVEREFNWERQVGKIVKLLNG